MAALPGTGSLVARLSCKVARLLYFGPISRVFGSNLPDCPIGIPRSCHAASSGYTIDWW
jgi:hypothetical protein